MTDEEKKAIERFRHNANYCITSIETTKIILNLMEKQQAELEKYKYLYQKALDNTIKSDRENMKKSKIINLMAEQLRTPVNSKEWVIDYYEKKIKEDK